MAFFLPLLRVFFRECHARCDIAMVSVAEGKSQSREILRNMLARVEAPQVLFIGF